MTELVDLVRELVVISAARVAKQYVGYVDQNDIEQEIWVWCLGVTHHRDGTDEPNEDMLRGWLESDEIDYHLGAWRTKRQFDRIGQRYSRREKAAQEGYEPQDEYFYSRGLVSELLPLAFGIEKQSDEHAKTSNTKDPAFGGDLAAMVEDIRAALDEVPGPAYGLLKARYRYEREVADLARENECVLSTMYGRINRALDKIVDALGGASPYGGEGQPSAD